ncbi:bifunctional DNA primase/polymerase [Streptomyces sp. NPDC087659]|uniref:bifunctional DNA primase/polymerase n=1 Tax=Streptomyces sp. NPDC087659 TaxID=3365801 RepID=UPI003825269C
MSAELQSSSNSSRQSAPTPSVAGPALATALWCAERGWPVHPLSPGRKFPMANCDECRRDGHSHHRCRCRAEGRWCHGFHAATLDGSTIEHWWKRSPQPGVGVSCGPASLVVIDVDVHGQAPPARTELLPGIPIPERIDLTGLANGFHTLGVLAALRGMQSPVDDSTTLRVRTPSGGLHIWYRVIDGRHWLCSSGSGGGRSLAWQVDVRAHGGYIVAPGTITAVGVYSPLGGAREPAPLPEWLAQELARTGHLPRPRAQFPQRVPSRAREAVIASGGGRDRAGRVLASVLAEVAACAAVAEGAGFSEKLNRAAFTLGGLVASGYLAEPSAARALQDVALATRSGQQRRIDQIIRSGLAAGVKRPLFLGRQS